ncbi:MAG: Trm112 family protein [Candidatus Hodarchaeota archaeon]
MKPWLFDILACPIDEYYPLQMYIFSYETEINDFTSFINIYRDRDLDIINKDEIIEIYREEKNLFINDGIIIEKNPLQTYLELILLSINEFEHVFDKSLNNVSESCFNLIKNEIRQKILAFSKDLSLNQIEKIIPELYFINKIKLNVEIKSGLLICPHCKRWYPIIDTIPYMLPDEYRNKNLELEFLKTNKNLLNDEFFKQDLKPFNI